MTLLMELATLRRHSYEKEGMLETMAVYGREVDILEDEVD